MSDNENDEENDTSPRIKEIGKFALKKILTLR